MKDILLINKATALDFVLKAIRFLNLPRNLFECDVQQCNPSLYKGRQGQAHIRKSKKALAHVKRAENNLTKLVALLEGKKYVTEKNKKRQVNRQSCKLG